jgi:hypothetical protein
MINNYMCDSACNVSVCGFDGLDCSEFFRFFSFFVSFTLCKAAALSATCPRLATVIVITIAILFRANTTKVCERFFVLLLFDFSCFNFSIGDCDCASGCTGYIKGDSTCDTVCNVSSCYYDNGNFLSLSLFLLILQQATARALLDVDSVRSTMATAILRATYLHAAMTTVTAWSVLLAVLFPKSTTATAKAHATYLHAISIIMIALNARLVVPCTTSTTVTAIIFAITLHALSTAVIAIRTIVPLIGSSHSLYSFHFSLFTRA